MRPSLCGNNGDKGFTLIELIVASGISITLIGIAAFSFIQGMTIFNTTMRGYRAETEMLSIMMAVKSTFSQATNIYFGGGFDNTFTARGAANADVTEGRIFQGAINNVVNGSTTLIAVGLRDMGVDESESTFYGFGVFFQAPTALRSGAMYVDLERNAGNGGFVRLSPVGAQLVYPGLTSLEVRNVRVRAPDGGIIDATNGVDDGQPALSAELVFRLRYFTSGRVADWRWCPATVGTPACATTAGFLEKERQFKLVFANNNIQDPVDDLEALPDRALGGIYFFRAFVPTARD